MKWYGPEITVRQLILLSPLIFLLMVLFSEWLVRLGL